MTTRTFVDKNGNSWEWEETPEVVEALKNLHETKNDTETTNVG
jgi:aspartyl/asparaginyl beta-hydroxylase (cupin superfamily)